MDSDKRAHPRFPAILRVTFEAAGHRVECRTRDVSLGGMFVDTTEVSLPFGTELLVELSIPLLADPAPVRCVVRWVVPGGMGVSFRSLRAAETWALNRLSLRARSLPR